MAALTAAALALSAASLGAGVYEKTQGDRKASSAYGQMAQGQMVAAQGAAQMHDISVAQAQASVGFAQQNLALNQQLNQYSVNAAQQSGAINSQIIAYNQQIQDQHRQAMELDAQRQQIENVRNQQQARSIALATATNQGARLGSGLRGGYGQIAGQTTANALNIGQNLQIGENVFGLNQQVTNQNIAMQQLNTLYAQQRANVQTQMSDLLYQNAVSNANFQTQQANAQSTIYAGQGYTAMAQGQLGQGQMQSQLGSQLISAAPGIFSAGMTLSNMAPTLQNYFTPTMSNNPQTGAIGNPFNLNSLY